MTLTATSATDGFDGVTASVSGGFSNINNLIGSSTITVDQLTGPDFDTNWQERGRDELDHRWREQRDLLFIRAFIWRHSG